MQRGVGLARYSTCTCPQLTPSSARPLLVGRRRAPSGDYFSRMGRTPLNLRTRCFLAAALLLASASACRRELASERGAMTGFRGISLSSPIPKPSFVLTGTDGQPYDFGKDTQGKVALLFFGYTHCPDVCPLHMANIAAVLQKLTMEQRNLVRVVFVTTDPERDTPARLKEWLGAIDPSFIGLTGTKLVLDSIQKALGMPPALKEVPEGGDSANYFIAHAAQVVAFARDGNAYLIYPNGIRQEDWAHDLPKLIDDATGESIRKELTASASNVGATTPPEAPVQMAGIVVPVAIIAQPLSRSEASLYLIVHNGTPQDDELVGISTSVASMATLHDSFSGGKMASIASVPVPRGGELRLEPGARHGMLMGLTKDLRAGDTVFVTLNLKVAGALEASAIVVPYADVQKTFDQVKR